MSNKDNPQKKQKNFAQWIFKSGPQTPITGIDPLIQEVRGLYEERAIKLRWAFRKACREEDIHGIYMQAKFVNDTLRVRFNKGASEEVADRLLRKCGYYLDPFYEGKWEDM